MSNTRRTTQQTPSRPFWLPDDGCPSWCEDIGRHRPRDFRADRHHYGERVLVPLTLHDPAEQDVDQWIPESWAMYLRQHVEASAPSIWLGMGESNQGSEMTLDEAEELARKLLEQIVGATTAGSRSRSAQRATIGLVAMMHFDEDTDPDPGS